MSICFGFCKERSDAVFAAAEVFKPHAINHASEDSKRIAVHLPLSHSLLTTKE